MVVSVRLKLEANSKELEQLALQEALLNPDFIIKGDSSEGTEQDVEEEFDATF